MKRAALLGLALLALFLPAVALAAEKSVGTACTSDASAADWDTIARCISGTMQRSPYFFGTTSDTCDGTLAGLTRYNGGALELCNGAAWVGVGSGASAILGSTTTGANPQRSGDATTGLFSPAASAVSVVTAGTERVRFDGSGNVGVGGTAVTGISLDVGTRTDSFRPAVGTTAQQPGCAAGTEGAIRYNTTIKTIEMCDGTSWTRILGSTCDSAPAYFPFSALTAQAPSTLVTSAIAAITGMDVGCGATVSVGGSGSPEYRVCSTSNCSSVDINWTQANNSVAMQGKYLQLRATTSATAGAMITVAGNIGPVSSEWQVSTAASDCSGNPIGTVCGDGTVYAGTSPAGGAMYTMRCDAGQTWSGSACTGARTAQTWNDGQGYWVDTSLTNCASAAACPGDGEANTTALIVEDANYGFGGMQTHAAAQYCADLNIHSQTDWYLPSINEMNVLYASAAAIGNFLVGGSLYWSSSEYNSSYGWFERFSDGYQNIDGKNSGYTIRCVRRNADVTPASLSFTNQTGLATAAATTSNIVQITGIDTATRAHIATISNVTTPELRICSDASCATVVISWTTGEVEVSNGQYIQLRMYSAGEASITRTAQVTVGDISAQWSLTTSAADPCAGSPNPGAVCSDGSVYAGTSPAGGAMYTTRCDAGQSWSGSFCTGSRAGATWNDSQGYWMDTSLTNCNAPLACPNDGEANTTALIAEDSNSNLAGVQQHAAAQYCADLNIHSQTDWYLPSINEVNVLFTNASAIGNFLVDGNWYWSSSEYNSAYAWLIRFSNGSTDVVGKNNGYYIRCVRR